ncbi:hypothetical protein HY285_03030 [Candidatus Peregrinibacteria bacterium]|nr:hypothetical protein [Candidatus Peregrinibacteria bacterium]MBI3816490.1 hypothetical protein [Candidatus Peregrinibacteria bacterium]
MQWFPLLSASTELRFGSLMLLGFSFLAAFFVLFTARDILLRTHLFTLQACSILLVALFPIGGFLVYLLIRPPRTIKDRAMEDLVLDLLERQTSLLERATAMPSSPAPPPSPPPPASVASSVPSPLPPTPSKASSNAQRKKGGGKKSHRR